MTKVPVLVLAFNRADHVTEALKAIREYQPDKLYLECDGPRAHKSGEKEAVEATRKAMLNAVDWPCEVKTLFREKNLGCAEAVYGAITWFFEYEEYGVIVEDDMIIGVDYYKMCEELLPRYQTEDRIMSILSINKSNRKDIPNSYIYSHGNNCYGWATWRRAWAKMDMSMSGLSSLSYWTMMRRFGVLCALYLMHEYRAGYKHLDTFSSWAYRWSLSIQVNGGLSIIPGVNLATNIGCTEGAHYGEYDIDPFKGLRIGKLDWPLEYNDTLIPDKKQFFYGLRGFYRGRWRAIRKKFRKLFHIKNKSLTRVN